jgi:uncharacterized membrane protein
VPGLRMSVRSSALFIIRPQSWQRGMYFVLLRGIDRPPSMDVSLVWPVCGPFLIHSLEARSADYGHLLHSWSDSVYSASGYSSVSGFSAPFWHAAGARTPGAARDTRLRRWQVGTLLEAFLSMPAGRRPFLAVTSAWKSLAERSLPTLGMSRHRFTGRGQEIWNAQVVTSLDENPDNRDDQPQANRLLSLSDGVIAIALTLLVLQLKVPSAEQVVHPDSAADLAAQLGKDSAQLISYGISFYVIAQFWLVHRQVFGLTGGHGKGLEWWNFLFLLTITIMPFTSTLLGDFVNNPLAVDIFAANLMIASLATQVMIIIGRRQGLIASGARARDERIRAVVAPVVLALSIGLSWWSTSAAMYSWILLAVAPAIVSKWAARHRRWS